MDIKPALEKLEANRDFKKWQHKSKGTYFSYAFKIPQEMKEDEWQFGFYNPKNDKITTFAIAGGIVNVRHEEDVFKREETKINKVDVDKIKLPFDTIMQKANEFQQSNFPKDRSIKTIAILQNLPELGNIWNLTYVTEAFNTLNIKIDALNGQVLEHNLTSIFSFRQKE